MRVQRAELAVQDDVQRMNALEEQGGPVDRLLQTRSRHCSQQGDRRRYTQHGQLKFARKEHEAARIGHMAG